MSKTTLWLSKHPRLTRWLLDVVLLWRWAAEAAMLTPHVEHATCLACLGRKRLHRDVHKVTLDMRRQLICRDCGLPMNAWKDQPRCAGLPPYTPRPDLKPAFVVLPLNW